jgi:para-aminobenzoate synthetase / 4-amino-4-deoxychorismate lyase
VQARLDSWDPRRGGRGFRFDGCLELVEARRADEVLPALARVEQAAAAGLHAVGFVQYEAASAFDPALVTRPPDTCMPLLRFAVFAERRAIVMPPAEAATPELPDALPSLDATAFAERVERIRSWIAAGDTYQVNLTFRLRTSFTGDVAALYRQLGAAQQAAYCACLRFGSHSILSFSPELFFRWRAGEIELRPMKGTRPRGRWTAEDRALAAELVESEKERAENLMIVDLLRNDVGRIAEWGSVHVPRLFEVERYATVHQMTSTIRARTRPGVGLRDVFQALFPCGSVTGAPKVRTSEIIAELEDSGRGVYTGAIGCVSADEAIFNVAIRTLVLDHRTTAVTLGVGSGITFDSDAAAEYRECLDKAAFVRTQARSFDLLETLRYDAGSGFFLLDEHLARLAASAERWDFTLDEDAVRAALGEAVRRHPLSDPLRVRLRVARNGAASAAAEMVRPLARPLRVALAREPVDSADPLLYHKTTDRLGYERRRAEHPDCDDVVLSNERGELTEFTIGNLVIRDGPRSLTPPRAAGLLPGVFREHLLREGRIHERVLRPEDLRRADAVYLINSVREWCKVVLS